MKQSLESYKKYLALTWKKGFIIIAYFLFISILNALITSDWLFIIFTWPFYLLPTHAFIAAILEWVYAYIIATILQVVLEHRKKQQ